MTSIARCILWSTLRGMKFLNHGAVKSWMAPWVVKIINVWGQLRSGGSIARKDKFLTESIELD